MPKLLGRAAIDGVNRLVVSTAWGDVPTWIGAVGTVRPAWIALIVYWQAQSDRRRQQARQISECVPGGVSLIPPG